jgi:hypothetical protein
LYANQSCTAALQDPGSTLIAPQTTPRLPIRIGDIPKATPLAVVIHGDSSVLGCLVAKPNTGQSSMAVEVPLEDTPLALSGSTLDVTMSTSNGIQALKERIATTIPTFVSGLSPGNHDLLELLAAMQSEARGSLQQEFTTLRTGSAWDSFVVDAYANVGGADLFRRSLREWLTQGVELLTTQPTFEFRLAFSPVEYTSPQLTILGVAGLDATPLGASSTALALSAEPYDRLNWSSTIVIDRASLLDLLAFTVASREFPGLSNVATPLERRLDCDAFGAQLDQRVVWNNANTRVCSTTCLAALCRSAILAMYQNATAAAFGNEQLLLNASGQLSVNTKAQPTGIAGSWIGGLASDSVAISGTFQSR